jgi:Xaa-Pro aminopeptidase
MKKDLDRLMKKMKVDAIYAEGHANRDENMYYLLNGANIFAHYIKRKGKPAYVVHSPIEREVAAETGHQLLNMNRYDRRTIQERYRDHRKANAHFVSMIFEDLKVRGDVVFYGNFPLGEGYNYAKQIQRASKRVTIYDGTGKGLIAHARATKDKDEIRRMNKVRNGVVHAFDVMLRYVGGCHVRRDSTVWGGKRRLLIGDLKRIIRRELFEQGFVDSAGLIVAQGRDAGVPHNSGRDRQPVKLGQPIVFDIYPQEIGGGYFFDFTRTVCFGYATEPVRSLYNTVSRARDYAIALLKVGRRTRDVEQKMCEFFEREGHKTLLSDAKNQVGYCHSLGHGVGLNIHESPFFNLSRTNTDRIQPGMVFTIEPGLYYPEKGYGVRIEDVIYISERGKVVNLTKYPRRLVVPI